MWRASGSPAASTASASMSSISSSTIPTLRDNPPRPPTDGVVPAKLFGLQHHRHDMLQPDTGRVLHHLRALADAHPGTALLGEVSSQEGAFARIARYTAGEDGLHLAYTLRPLRQHGFEHALGEALAESEAASPGSGVCWAFSNHDVERAVSRWNPLREAGLPPPKAFARMLPALLLALGGSVCLYQGEELGLEEARLALEDLRDPFGIAYYPEFAGRDGSRTPMPWVSDAPHAGFTTGTPWLPVPHEHLAASVAAQEADPNSLLQDWRGLMQWRKAHPTLRLGNCVRLALAPPLIGFERRHGQDRVLAIFNPSPETVRVNVGLGPAQPWLSPGTRSDTDAAWLAPYGFVFAAVSI